MSKTTAKPDDIPQSEEAKVIDYLQKNPGVLESYPEVFTALSIPHHGGGVASLVERQLKILRAENATLKKNLAELVSIARENEELNQRFHRLATELISANQLHDVLAMVQDQVQTFFTPTMSCSNFCLKSPIKRRASAPTTWTKKAVL